MDAGQFERSLLAALERRRVLHGELTLFRVLDGEADGVPGCFIDKFGPVLLIHLRDDEAAVNSLQSMLAGLGEIIRQHCSVSSVYLRIHLQDAKSTAREVATLLAGAPCQDFEAEEADLRFILNAESQTNCGLFLDMRDVRRMLRETAGGERVLNTFCFTGSLGIAAAAGGAREVVQVDSSRAAIHWAKKNSELNATRISHPVRYIVDDALVFMQRELRRLERGGEPYDKIIIDPPSYGSSKHGKFSFEKDIGTCVGVALKLLKPGGSLFVFTNYRQLTVKQLVAKLREDIRASGVKARITRELLPPAIDFPSSPESSATSKGVQIDREKRGAP